MTGRNAVACDQVALVRKCAALRPAVNLVWTPDSPRLVTPWELPFLAGAVKERRRAVLGERIKYYGFMCFLWIGLALTHLRSREFQIFAALAVVAGILPLITAVRVRRRMDPGEPYEGPGLARMARFAAWMKSRPMVSAWILGACIAAAGAWQLIVGVDRSIDMAGQVKPLVWNGEPWRLLTAGFLHIGALHFVLNAAGLVALAKMAEAFTSWWHVIVVFLVSILAGSLASQFLSGGLSVGSSGGILGILGLLAVFAWRRRAILPRSFLRSIAMMILGIAVLGAIAAELVDNAAHAGGLAGGAAVGWILLARRGIAIPVGAGRILRAAGIACLVVIAATGVALPLTAKSRGMYDGLVSAGRHVGKTGDTKMAMRLLDRAIALNPELPGAFMARAECRVAAKDYAGAIRDADEAVKRAPQSPESYKTRIFIQFVTGNVAGGFEDANRALALQPADPDLLDWRAWFHFLHRRYDEALKDCETALAAHPEHTWSLNTRGQIKDAKGDSEGAIRDYSEALRLDPKHPYAYSNRGDVKLKRGDLDGALADYEATLGATPKDSDALYGRARVRLRRDDRAGARQDLEAALESAIPGWYRRAEAEAALRGLDSK